MAYMAGMGLALDKVGVQGMGQAEELDKAQVEVQDMVLVEELDMELGTAEVLAANKAA